MIRPAVLGLLVLFGSPAAAEAVRYQIYEIQADGARKLLAEGVREYSPSKDIEIIKRDHGDGRIIWWKRLHLTRGYELEATVARDKTLDVFALVINERGNQAGFALNAFKRTDADVFVQDRGQGRVKASYKRGRGYVELAGVKFLDDVIFNYTKDMRRHQPGSRTHEIIIAKGSVFRVAP